MRPISGLCHFRKLLGYLMDGRSPTSAMDGKSQCRLIVRGRQVFVDNWI